MESIRLVRSGNYTTVSNVFLRDTGLSLRAKGLLTMMLSFPDDWNFNMRGLIAICTEGKHAVYVTMRELIEKGYCRVTKVRSDDGRFVKNLYTIYESPEMCKFDDEFEQEFTHETEKPIDNQSDYNNEVDEDMDVEAQKTTSPNIKKPDTKNPYPKNQPQLNTYIIKDLKNKNIKKEIRKKMFFQIKSDEKYSSFKQENDITDTDVDRVIDEVIDYHSRINKQSISYSKLIEHFYNRILLKKEKEKITPRHQYNPFTPTFQNFRRNQL